MNFIPNFKCEIFIKKFKKKFFEKLVMDADFFKRIRYLLNSYFLIIIFEKWNNKYKIKKYF